MSTEPKEIDSFKEFVEELDSVEVNDKNVKENKDKMKNVDGENVWYPWNLNFSKSNVLDNKRRYLELSSNSKREKPWGKFIKTLNRLLKKQ